MIRVLIYALCLVAAALSIYNVYGEDAGTQKLAEGIACGGAGCVKLLRAERTPIGQSFTFQTGVNPPQTKSVNCDRQYVLVGSFDCSLTVE